MATVNNNLSDYDINSVPDASKMVFGIVVSLLESLRILEFEF